MARSKRCLGVDISNTHINIADVETTPDGLRIRKLVSSPLPEFATGEFEDAKKRQEAYASLFKQLQKQEKLGGAAVFSVSGNYFFVRKLALPMASEERLEKIIQFESRQQIPLPPDKTVRQYQVFPKPEEKEAEVVLAAAKRDNIQDFMKIVDWSGFKARSLSVSSLALFNFFAYLQGGDLADQKKKKKAAAAKDKKKGKGGLSFLKKKKKGEDKSAEEEEVNPAIGADTETEVDPFMMDAMPEEGYEEVKAYLNLGTRTLDICIARISEKNKILGFPRSVPLLGPTKEILKALKKRFNLESEKDAQVMLETKQIAAMTFDFDAESNPELDLDASEVVSEVFDAMVGEVRRSLDFYISQPDGMAVDSVVLTGLLSKIQNIAPFFEEKLGLPTQILDIDQTGGGKKISGTTSLNIAPFVIATGLAIEGLDHGVITNVNFLPEDMKILQEFKTKYVMLSAVALFLVANIYLGAQLGQQSVQMYRDAATSLEDEIRVLTPLVKKTEEAIETRRSVAKKYEQIYKALPNDRAKPLEILGMIQKMKPPNIYVKVFFILPFGELHLIGETESSETAVQLVDNIRANMTEYYDAADKKSAPHLLWTRDIRSATGQQVVEFELQMKIKGIASVLQTPTPTPTPEGARPSFMGRPGQGRPGMMEGERF